MCPYPLVQLQPKREKPVLAGHPWILSGAVAGVEGPVEPGCEVRVANSQGNTVGYGDYDPDSQIRVRMRSFGPNDPVPEPLWLREALERAVVLRRGHPRLQGTDAIRLVHAEADGLPGLTVDRYADWLVVKPTTPAMQRRLPAIAAELEELTGARGGLRRGDGPEAPQTVGPEAKGTLFGEVPEHPVQIVEGGRRYAVDLRHGQKTGFYLDQRDSRALFQSLASGARALDLFSYSGGFAAAAVAGGAVETVAVESSKRACDLLSQNAPAAEVIQDDVAHFVRSDERSFDLICIDPPPFARRKRDADAACRAYKDLNLWALRRAAPNAHLLTFSCSHHISADQFQKTVTFAAADLGREIQFLGQLGAAVDHPVSSRHAQGEYLRGWLVRAL